MSDIYLAGSDPTRISLGLERMAELLFRLGDPQKHLKYIHVAGTNGKGSVSAMTASILSAAGYRTGLYTSPALEHAEERIQINGASVPSGVLSALSDRVRRAAEGMAEMPTEFECMTAIAFLYFSENACDYAVVEVGLGGAGDATNVIPSPAVCVLTAMGLDHTRILGNTVGEIASVKAGILKPGTRAVSFGNAPEADAVFEAVCIEKDIPFARMDRSRLSDLSVSLDGCRFALSPYGVVHIPFAAAYQAENALLAVTAAEALRETGCVISDDAVRSGLKNVIWPGRLELLRKEPVFLLDGSHNPHGLRATVDALKLLLPGIEPVILMSVMADKDVSSMLPILREISGRFVTVTADNPRAMKAETLAGLLRDSGAEAFPCDSVAAGVRLACEDAGRDGAVCALGTLYFSGAVRSALHSLK